jgi:hypothetical protein
VWTVYPPLLYLMGGMLWIGLGRVRRGRRTSGPAPSVLISTRVLAGLALLEIARIVLCLADATVIDVGYGLVVGAHMRSAGSTTWIVQDEPIIAEPPSSVAVRV